MNTLRFSPGNAKLKNIPSISLLAGWSCPFADECLTKVDLITGKIIDGPNQKFRCFSATQENIFPIVRKQREYNFNLLRSLRSPQEMAELIQASLPQKIKRNIIRLHVSGDFFNQNYFDAWIIVANNNPHLTFYAYTKSIQFWVNRMDAIPVNLKLTASIGGKQDKLIYKHNLKYNLVVSSPEEAERLGLEIDHDDSHAYGQDKSFAILIHGTQKAGSEMGKAKNALRRRGIMGYQRKSKTPTEISKFETLTAA